MYLYKVRPRQYIPPIDRYLRRGSCPIDSLPPELHWFVRCPKYVLCCIRSIGCSERVAACKYIFVVRRDARHPVQKVGDTFLKTTARRARGSVGDYNNYAERERGWQRAGPQHTSDPADSPRSPLLSAGQRLSVVTNTLAAVAFVLPSAGASRRRANLVRCLRRPLPRRKWWTGCAVCPHAFPRDQDCLSSTTTPGEGGC